MPANHSDIEKRLWEAADELRQLILTRFRDVPFTIDQVKQGLMQESKFLIRASGYRSRVR